MSLEMARKELENLFLQIETEEAEQQNEINEISAEIENNRRMLQGCVDSGERGAYGRIKADIEYLTARLEKVKADQIDVKAKYHDDIVSCAEALRAENNREVTNLFYTIRRCIMAIEFDYEQFWNRNAPLRALFVKVNEWTGDYYEHEWLPSTGSKVREDLRRSYPAYVDFFTWCDNYDKEHGRDYIKEFCQEESEADETA